VNVGELRKAAGAIGCLTGIVEREFVKWEEKAKKSHELTNFQSFVVAKDHRRAFIFLVDKSIPYH
jgi:hypothetical protein